MDNPTTWLLVRILFSAILYHAAAFLLRLFVLLYFRRRYSTTNGMEAFLGRFRLKQRALSFENELDTLAAIHKRHAHAWGMMGMGTVSFCLFWQQIPQGQFPWLLLGTSLAVAFLHAQAMASSAFAAQCFRDLGISSLEAYFQPVGNAPRA